MRSKLENQIQQDLRQPPSRPLPEDPFEGFRKPLFDPFCTCGVSFYCDKHPGSSDEEDAPAAPVYQGKGHINRTATQRNINRRAERKLKALVQACADLHHRGTR